MVLDRSWSWIGGSYSLTEFYYTGLCDRSLLLLRDPLKNALLLLKENKGTFYSKVISNSKWYFTRSVIDGRKAPERGENEPELKTKYGYE